jgi:hypothetical protein
MRIPTPEELEREQAERERVCKVLELQARLRPLEREQNVGQFAVRLQRRYLSLLETMSRNPQKSFPQMVADAAELEALYRFLSNREVTADKLLGPHIAETVRRGGHLRRLLAVYDTSGISYAGEGTREGLGSLADGGHGYYLHLGLAVSADGHRVPLGVLTHEALVRTEPADKSRTYRQRRNDPDKEALRWRRGVQKVEELFAGSDTELVHIMDREGDDFELLDTLSRAQRHFVIRSKYDRLLEQSVLTSEERCEAPRKLREALSTAEVLFEREVYLSPRKKDRSTEKRKTHPPREGRLTRLAGSAARVRIKRPAELKKADGWSDFVELNVVRVWEPEPPAGEKPVEWYLLTSEPIDSLEQILEIVDFYRARWVIEEFFKALKSGCSIEKRQLESRDALLRVLAMFLPIAYRLLLLRSAARCVPHLPATLILTPSQIQILRIKRPKLKLPEQPTIHEALLAVAALGGHLKHNGYPGWQTLGRGWQELLIIDNYLSEAHLQHVEPNTALPHSTPHLIAFERP